MPSYELFLITSALQKDKLVSCVKRVGDHIFFSNGIIRKIEYLGLKTMLHNVTNRIWIRNKRPSHANYFIYHCDIPPHQLETIKQKSYADSDVYKAHFVYKGPKIASDYVCTLDQELLPPSYRPSVQKLIKEGRPYKEKFDIGLDLF